MSSIWVPDFGALGDGNGGAVYDEIASIVEPGPARVKVILEAGRLGREALQLLVEARSTPGRRFLRPASGFGPAATRRAGQLELRELARGRAAITKGGRSTTLEQALLVEAGATRLGNASRGGRLMEAPAPSTLHWFSVQHSSTSPPEGGDGAGGESRTGGLEGLCLKSGPLGENDAYSTLLSDGRRLTRLAVPGAPPGPAAAWRRLCVCHCLSLQVKVGGSGCDGFRQLRCCAVYSQLPKGWKPWRSPRPLARALLQLVPSGPMGVAGSSTTC